MTMNTEQLTQEIEKLKSQIGKPSMQPRPAVEDATTEAVYRSCVQIFPSGEGRRSRCNVCGLESNVDGWSTRHDASCELAKLYIRAGGASQIHLAFGSRTAVQYRQATAEDAKG